MCSLQKEFHTILYELQVAKKLQKLQSLISDNRFKASKDSSADTEKGINSSQIFKNSRAQLEILKRRLATADEYVDSNLFLGVPDKYLSLLL